MSDFVTRNEFTMALESIKEQIRKLDSDGARLRDDTMREIGRLEDQISAGIASLKEWSDEHSKNNRRLILGMGSGIMAVGIAVGTIIIERTMESIRIETETQTELHDMIRQLCASGVIQC